MIIITIIKKPYIGCSFPIYVLSKNKFKKYLNDVLLFGSCELTHKSPHSKHFLKFLPYHIKIDF